MVARDAFAFSFCPWDKHVYLYFEPADEHFFKSETNEQQNILTENHTFLNTYLLPRNVKWTPPHHDIRL
jgi:hypothetical protein